MLRSATARSQALAKERDYWRLYVAARNQAALSDAQVVARAPGLSDRAPGLLKLASDEWGD